MDAELLDILLIVEGHIGWFKGMFHDCKLSSWKIGTLCWLFFYLRNKTETVERDVERKAAPWRLVFFKATREG